MTYADYVYEIVRNECINWDAIYRDYILELVGVFGLNALIGERMIESCGSVSGRQLYVLCRDKVKKN